MVVDRGVAPVNLANALDRAGVTTDKTRRVIAGQACGSRRLAIPDDREKRRRPIRDGRPAVTALSGNHRRFILKSPRWKHAASSSAMSLIGVPLRRSSRQKVSVRSDANALAATKRRLTHCPAPFAANWV